MACLAVASVSWGQVVPWALETAPIPSTQAGDPAFVAGIDGGASTLIGTDRAQIGWYPLLLDGGIGPAVVLGPVSGADFRDGLLLVTQATGAVVPYQLQEGASFAPLQSPLSVPTPQCITLGQGLDGGVEFFVDTSSPTIKHFAVVRPSPDAVQFSALPDVAVPATPSALAVDERLGRLYVGLPSRGIYRIEADGTAGFVVSIDAGTLGPVVGGVDVFPIVDGGTLLFSTSPATDTVSVHEVAESQATFLGSFQVGAPGGGPLRVRSPQHLELVELPFEGFPQGALILHDGLRANYKVVSLVEVSAVVPLPAPFVRASPGTTDAGAMDAGTPDAGPKGNTVVSNGGSGAMAGAESIPRSCGCEGSPAAMACVAALAWWFRRTGGGRT